MITQAMGLGLVLSFIFTEVVGLSAGGLIVPGYLAIYWDNPPRLGATLVVALLTYLIVRILSSFTILYSRRRFIATILIGFLVGWGLDMVLLRAPAGYQDVRAIGFVISGLIANDMVKQGVVNTVLSILFITTMVRLIMLGIN
ncbi:MAG: poly-gamma-glutamate biosynthesis protein PgsC [Firmicutes bacterium]|nr:poly-gamma-glutamate biosynthesis protein PgsC [Bacillota bacterium]